MSVSASKMVRGWEPANFEPTYKNFADAGWTKYEARRREITNLYINNSVSLDQTRRLPARI